MLDNFFGEEARLELLQQIIAPGFNVSAPPPDAKLKRVLSDLPGLPQTLGLTSDALHGVSDMPSRAVLEIQILLTHLYPDSSYGVASTSRLLKIICLFCKRAL